MAANFGNQPEYVVRNARHRAEEQERRPEDGRDAKAPVSFARESIFEREAVSDERAILRDALRSGMGETTYKEIRGEFDAR